MIRAANSSALKGGNPTALEPALLPTLHSRTILKAVERATDEAFKAAPMRRPGFNVGCMGCGLREMCLPIGFSGEELHLLDPLVTRRKTIRRFEALYRAGDDFGALYAVRSGFFKTCVTSECGRDQVTGFQMTGELLGFDGMGTERHMCDAVALEDSQVCVIPFSELENRSRDFPELQHEFHKIMSREIVRDHGVMLLLGGMRAEERLAAFILDLANRHRSRGFSGLQMVLRMTRKEIGSYLGLKLETVSRTFSKFQEHGLLEVRKRNVCVLDEGGLHRIVNETSA